MPQDRDMERNRSGKQGERQGDHQKQQGGGQGTRQHQQGDEERSGRQQDAERGGSGNFKNDPERAAEAGRKGGSR